VIQRVLLIINKGYYGSILLIIQSCVTIIGLFIYQSFNIPNLLVGLLVYLGPQVLVYLPIIIGFTLKVLRKKNIQKKAKARSITIDAVGFSGIGFLSIIFLGSDYYYASHYLNPDEIISYYPLSSNTLTSFALILGRGVGTSDVFLNDGLTYPLIPIFTGGTPYYSALTISTNINKANVGFFVYSKNSDRFIRIKG
jgi:hypothetical protein